MVPEAIQSSDGDMLMNLDVFDMFPSIESADRRFAFLHRVLRGEFPCFDGTIKALRLPAAHLAALRFLRLAIPRLFVNEGLSNPVTPDPGAWRRRDLPSSWGSLKGLFAQVLRPRWDRRFRPLQNADTAPDHYTTKATHDKMRFRGCIAWL